MSTRPEGRRRRTARDPSTARRAAVAPPAPGDGPAGARRAPERRRSHSSREAAPAPLDARLLPPALAAWAGAAWAVGLSGERAWLRVLAAALVLSIAALPLGISARRFHPPRHRDDPRPGAGAPNGSAIGSARASLLLTVLVAVAVLVVATAGLWSRGADPLARAAGDGRAAALTGTVETEPRVVPGSRRTTVVATLAVTAVDGCASRQSALVLGGREWLGMPMGAAVRVRAVLRPGDPGDAHAAVLSSSSAVRLTAPPGGALAVVGSLRAGLAEAVGDPYAVPGRWRWPEGARELVSGVALGDDHALPAGVRDDMRTVSMTHLTAVSGEHVAIVLGLVMSGLGVLPRRCRAVAGALVLVALVVLVRPGGSVLRAAAMGGVLLVGVASGRRSASLPSPSCSSSIPGRRAPTASPCRRWRRRGSCWGPGPCRRRWRDDRPDGRPRGRFGERPPLSRCRWSPRPPAPPSSSCFSPGSAPGRCPPTYWRHRPCPWRRSPASSPPWWRRGGPRSRA